MLSVYCHFNVGQEMKFKSKNKADQLGFVTITLSIRLLGEVQTDPRNEATD